MPSIVIALKHTYKQSFRTLSLALEKKKTTAINPIQFKLKFLVDKRNAIESERNSKFIVSNKISEKN